MKGIFAVLAALVLAAGCVKEVDRSAAPKTAADTLTYATHFRGERHLDRIRQLTFGGQNAEASIALSPGDKAIGAGALAVTYRFDGREGIEFVGLGRTFPI
ncbi:MAG TPA: hypothetical protein PKY95_06580, partial [candidate division Zixibacteria bacterium]|nr:hypothetical protein [candidate division Zixibacteria bacterium]